MTKRLLFCAVALALVAGMTLVADGKGKTGSWTGWITDTKCGAKGTAETHAACAKKCVGEGGKYAFYNPEDKKVYNLAPQDKVAAHAGHHVTVKGSVEGDTITITSIDMAADPNAAKPKS
jgi:hypothetical protein